MCGTPRGYGNWSYNLFTKADTDPEWASFKYTTLEGGQVPANEIEQARNDLDERTFKQEYEASFVNYAGQIYYNFDRVKNVIPQYNPESKKKLHEEVGKVASEIFGKEARDKRIGKTETMIGARDLVQGNYGETYFMKQQRKKASQRSKGKKETQEEYYTQSRKQKRKGK